MSRIRAALSRIPSLLLRRRFDARLDEEITTHLELLAAENVRQGMSLDAARAAARREFGAVQQLREEHRTHRGLPVLDSISQDLRYAFRTLLRQPLFAVAAIGILALGIGPNVAVFSIVDAILFRSLPFRDPGRLVEITSSSIHNQASLAIIRDGSRVADYACWGDSSEANLTGQGEPARIEVSTVSGNLFEVLGVHPVRGRSFSREEESPGRGAVAIISSALWQSRFSSDPAILGRPIRLDDTVRRVVGVMPSDFRFPSPSTQAWIPAAVDPRNDGFYWWAFSLTMVGRLHPGATEAMAQSDVRRLIPRIRDGFPWKMWPDWASDTAVVSLQQALTGSTRPRLLILFGSVLLILIITCSNLASLMLSRGIARQREVATRNALGAGRWRILRQLLTEGLLIAALGAAAGIVLAFAIEALLIRCLPAGTPQINQIAINGRVLLFTAATALVAAVAFSAIPAFLLLNSNLHTRVHSAGRITGQKASSALVVVEMALAVMLISAAALMGRSLQALSGIDTGFRSDHILTARVSPNASTCHSFGSCPDLYDRLLQNVRSTPGVQTVASASTIPLEGQFSAFASELQGHPLRPGSPAPMLWMTSTTPDYFRAMGIPLIRGRGFSELDTAKTERVIIVSAATAAKWWPGEDPLGKHIRASWLKQWRRVVGVVPDVQILPVGQAFGPILGQTYLPYRQPLADAAEPVMTLLLRVSDDPLTHARDLRLRVRALSPDTAVSAIRTMDEVVRDALSTPRSMLWLLFSFAVLALALGIAGIYSVISWNISRRVPEIGVRMALGATPGSVTGMVLRQTVLIAGAGVCLGTAGAFLTSRLLRSLLYGVSPHDPISFGFAGLILVATGLLAGYIPARRAARIDPLTALRYD